MHDYQDRNGVSEQTRWLRQQPQSLKHLPWDFELEAEQRKIKILGIAGFWAVLIFLVAVYVSYYYC